MGTYKIDTESIRVRLSEEETISVSVADDTVLALKEAIEINTGIPITAQTLFFHGTVMKDHHRLSEYHSESPFELQFVNMADASNRQAKPSGDDRLPFSALVSSNNTQIGIPIVPDHVFSVTFHARMPMEQFKTIRLRVYLKDYRCAQLTDSSTSKQKVKACQGQWLVDETQRLILFTPDEALPHGQKGRLIISTRTEADVNTILQIIPFVVQPVSEPVRLFVSEKTNADESQVLIFDKASTAPYDRLKEQIAGIFSQTRRDHQIEGIRLLRQMMKDGIPIRSDQEVSMLHDEDVLQVTFRQPSGAVPPIPAYLIIDRKRLSPWPHFTKKKGSGAYATIYECTYDGAPAAVKLIHQELQDLKAFDLFFAKEVTVWSQLHHPHIVRLLGVCHVPSKMMIMELMSISLRDYLSSSELPRLTEEQQLRYARHITMGLRYLHHMNPAIVHRDIKAENVLLSADLMIAKLADFGSTRVLNQEGKLDSVELQLGTPGYIAPEVISNPHNQGCFVDIYALGMTFYEILVPSFRIRIPSELMELPLWESIGEMHQQGFRPPTPPGLVTGFSRAFWILIQQCWADIPEERGTARCVLDKLALIEAHLQTQPIAESSRGNPANQHHFF